MNPITLRSEKWAWVLMASLVVLTATMNMPAQAKGGPVLVFVSSDDFRYSAGEKVTLTVAVKPESAGERITLTVTDASGEQTNAKVTTDRDGEAEYSFSADGAPGSWTVSATSGDLSGAWGFGVMDASRASSSDVVAAAPAAPDPNCPNPTKIGTDGDDTIAGTAGPDVINAGDGDDKVFGLGGNDKICLGPGNDTANGHAGVDTIFGGSEFDHILGGPGNDILRGGSESDRIEGQTGNDQIFGESGFDLLLGQDGADNIRGGSEGDSISGGLGNDQIAGETDGDFEQGDEGDDTMFGGSGKDFLHGGPGDDILTGNSQNDILDARDMVPDNDFMDGKLGNDQCDGDPDPEISCEI